MQVMCGIDYKETEMKAVDCASGSHVHTDTKQWEKPVKRQKVVMTYENG